MSIVVESSLPSPTTETTFLNAVNEVQKRLRETQTAAYNTSTYSTLIASFVNQAKREVEDAWNWSFLRQNVTVSTISGTSQYTLTGTNARSRLFGAREVYDDTNNTVLREVSDQIFDRDNYLATAQSGNPVWFRFRGVSSGAKQVDLFPTPNGSFTIYFPMIIPQADLTSDSTTITVPAHPVIMRAYALAISERGEDGGMSYAEADDMARQSLADAIAQDSAQFYGELVWDAC